jgi:hypothetical protein
MFAPLMGPLRSRRAAAAAACVGAAVGAAGCGGGERQDAAEAAGSYRVEIASASFPLRQSLAQRTTLRVRVRNADARTLPNVALTVKTRSRHPASTPSAFGQSIDDPRFADAERPVWIVDRGPAGADTAYTNTWALGPLAPGEARTFAFRLTAVEPGAYWVDYQVSPGLAGRARLAAGSQARGTFHVKIDDAPADARVADDGEVIRDR